MAKNLSAAQKLQLAVDIAVAIENGNYKKLMEIVDMKGELFEDLPAQELLEILHVRLADKLKEIGVLS